MAILTGPEIKRLATPCPASELKHYENVWLDGVFYYVYRNTDLKDTVLLRKNDHTDQYLCVPVDMVLQRCLIMGERIVINPFDPKCVGPNSYDVHLGETLRIYDIPPFSHSINPDNPPPTREIPLKDGRWNLLPGTLYLASTREYTETYNLVPKLEGRSSIARLGVKIHLTAGFGDSGFKGHWTMEIEVTHPIYLRPGMRIGQICYTTMLGEQQEYRGRYQNQSAEPVASRFHLGDNHTATETVKPIPFPEDEE